MLSTCGGYEWLTRPLETVFVVCCEGFRWVVSLVESATQTEQHLPITSDRYFCVVTLKYRLPRRKLCTHEHRWCQDCRESKDDNFFLAIDTTWPDISLAYALPVLKHAMERRPGNLILFWTVYFVKSKLHQGRDVFILILIDRGTRLASVFSFLTQWEYQWN